MSKFKPLNIILTTPIYGGHESMLLEWMGEIKKLNICDIKIYSSDIKDIKEKCNLKELKLYIINFNNKPARGFKRLLYDIKNNIILWNLLSKLDSEEIIIFAPGVVQMSPLDILTAVMLNKKCVCYVPMAYKSSSMGFKCGRVRDFFTKLIVKRVKLWITITDYQKKLLSDNWVNPRDVILIPNRIESNNGVELIGKKNDIPTNKLKILFVGRFEKNHKGLDWYLEALEKYYLLNKNVEFIFQGKGDFESEILRFQERISADVVKVFPWGDASQNYSYADLLVLPSRFEGLPLVAIEASQYDLPVVATLQSGLSDYVDNKFLVDFGDTNALHAAFNSMKDPGLRNAAAKFTKEKFEKELSKEKFLESIKNVVLKISHIN